jgi:hypothetical protein
MIRKKNTEGPRTVEDFLVGKPEHTLSLFHSFVQEFKKIGPVELLPAKTMIGVATPRKRIAWITQLGKDFVHIVFPFEEEHSDNLCFQKIARVPGGSKQFNHHFRMYAKEDLNEEVIRFMKLAYEEGG